jgi:hypothetical protein
MLLTTHHMQPTYPARGSDIQGRDCLSATDAKDCALAASNCQSCAHAARAGDACLGCCALFG